MILTTAAFDQLTKKDISYPYMVNYNLKIPHGDHEFTASPAVRPGSGCNEVYYSFGDYYAIVILLPIAGEREGAVYKLFCKKGTRSESNFTHLEEPVHLTINGKRLHKGLDCGEQLFKLYCVLSQIENDPADADESLVQNRLSVMHEIHTAVSPVNAKKATSALTPFDGDAWDKVSFEAMVATQKWKATAENIHDEMKYLAHLADKHDIPLRNIFFVECADPHAKFAPDFKWGCGHSAEELKNMLLSNPEYPWGDANVTDTIHKDCPYSGGNGLGRALQIALRFVLGDNGEYLRESVEEYRLRFGTEMPLVSYTPKADVSVTTAQMMMEEVSVAPIHLLKHNSDLLPVEPVHLLKHNSDLLPVEPVHLPVETEEEDDDVVFVREERSPTETKRARSITDNDTSSARAPSVVEAKPECARTLSMEDDDAPACGRTLSLYP